MTGDGPGPSTIRWDRPILIGGCGSSGTTLLSVMLHAHPDVLCGPELNLFAHRFFWMQEGQVWQERLLRYLNLGFRAMAVPEWSLANGLCPYLGIAFDHTLQWYGMTCEDLKDLVRKSSCADELIRLLYGPCLRAQGKRIWAEKSPPNLYSFEAFLTRYPKGRVVYLVRDARDVTCSLMRRGWGGFKKALATWLIETALCECYREHSRVFRLRYEDLVQTPAPVVEKLLEFLELSPETERVLDYVHTSSRVSRADVSSAGLPTWHSSPQDPITTKAVGSWRSMLTNEQLLTMANARIVQDLEGYPQLKGTSGAQLLDRLEYAPIEVSAIDRVELVRLIREERLFMSGNDYVDPTVFHERFVACDAACLPMDGLPWERSQVDGRVWAIQHEVAQLWASLKELEAQHGQLQERYQVAQEEIKALRDWQHQVRSHRLFRVGKWIRRMIVKAGGGGPQGPDLQGNGTP